jgi:mRNA-degrading endonuclease YafQ of YafQ-DinJ toxin-antitoxin module
VANITRSQHFQTTFRQRANRRIKALFDQRIPLFAKNPYDRSLRFHALKDSKEGHFSVSLTDDAGRDDDRVILTRSKRGFVLVDFGTHDQLYRPWRRADERK